MSPSSRRLTSSLLRVDVTLSGVLCYSTTAMLDISSNILHTIHIGYFAFG